MTLVCQTTTAQLPSLNLKNLKKTSKPPTNTGPLAGRSSEGRHEPSDDCTTTTDVLLQWGLTQEITTPRAGFRSSAIVIAIR